MEVKSGHGIVRAGRNRLLLEPDGAAVGVELDHVIALGISHVVRKVRGAVLLDGSRPQLLR
jgi:hypothetical protein